MSDKTTDYDPKESGNCFEHIENINKTQTSMNSVSNNNDIRDDLLAEFDPLYEETKDETNKTKNEIVNTSNKVIENVENIDIHKLSIDYNKNEEEIKENKKVDENEKDEKDEKFSTIHNRMEPFCETLSAKTTTTTPATTIVESDSPGNLAQEYQLKWIIWKGGERYPIVTQNSNGPCPLLAIINVLLLRKSITIRPMFEIITASQLMDFLCDSILNSIPSNIDDEERMNYEQNLQDAMFVLPKLATGLDVNVKFSGVDQFEYTQESIIFDLLNIPLVHGWLANPDDYEIHRIVANSSYNQLIDRIISSKGPNGDCASSEMLLAEEFLNNSASQLTHYGLYRLQQYIQEDQLAIFFRNNHFITLYKRNNQLYQLATDQGFLSEPNLVWESLNSIEGDTHFVDSNFVPSQPQTREPFVVGIYPRT